MKQPTVSVVIPNWFGKDVIEQCLKSLESQTHKPTEIIIVENGHTDNSPELIKKNFPNVKIIQLEKNVGFAGGVNVGIKASSSDYIWLFNNDAIAKKDCLAQLVNTATTYKADITSSVILTDNGKKIDSCGDIYTIYGMPYPEHRGLPVASVPKKDKQIFSASGGASLYKTNLFSEIGLFDESFFAYYEDVDISMRAQLQKKSVWLSHNAIVSHRISHSSNKVPGFGREMAIRNSIYLFWKNVPFPLLFNIMPRFIYSNLRLTLSTIIRGYPIKALHAHLSAFFHFLPIIVKRHNIQKNKKLTSSQFSLLISKCNPLKFTKQRQ